MTPRELREQIATDLRGAVPDGWTVYAAPPEGVTAPSLVIAPRAPYRTRVTFPGEEIRLGLVLLVQRNASRAGLDLLDDVTSDVLAALSESTTGASWDEVTDLGPAQDVGSLDYLTATINITAHL